MLVKKKKKDKQSKVPALGVKISLKIRNFLKTLQRDLKRVKVDPKQVLKKDSLYRKRKKESSRNEKKNNKKIWRDKKREVQDESDTGDKNIVEGVVQKRLVFLVLFEKNLSKVANLDQKTYKKKTIKGKLGKESITSSLYKINKCKLSKVRQSKLCNNSGPRFWLFCFKDSKVVYFKC